MEIKVTKELTTEQIGDLLCSALEGGSNYWYMITQAHRPAAWPKGESHFMHEYPLTEDGYLLITDEVGGTDEQREIPDNKPFKLDLAAIKRGLEIMGTDFVQHFADAMTDNGDAETGDVFLQCCVFGKLIYG